MCRGDEALSRKLIIVAVRYALSGTDRQSAALWIAEPYNGVMTFHRVDLLEKQFDMAKGEKAIKRECQITSGELLLYPPVLDVR
jgi:hypothetical protein